MTFLELAQALRREAGASGTGPDTVVGQTGEYERLVEWINQSNLEIERKHAEWGWLLASNALGSGLSFATVNNQAVYDFGAGPGTLGIEREDFGRWRRGTFRNYVTTVGVLSEILMNDDITYDQWRDAYLFGANRDQATRPNVLAVAPDKQLCLGPVADGLTTVTGDYYLKAKKMDVDDDSEPRLPEDYHDLIWQKALKKYGLYESAPEVVTRSNSEYLPGIRKLESLYVPRISMGPALA